MYLQTRSEQDHLFNFYLKLNGFFTTFAVVMIFLFVGKESFLALQGHSINFLLDDSWYPTEGKFNLTPMLMGSLYVTLGSVVLALPLGLFSAILACFYLGSKSRWLFVRAMELYTGIPSVVFGFWGLMKIVPLINQWHPPGQSLLAGILVLALMIFPILTLSLISSFEMSSDSNYRVSKSLGLKNSTYIWKVLIPSTRGQMLGGILLSLGRAIGETMAVLMVCGNIVKVPSSVFEPVRTLTANIALEMAYAMDGHRSALFLSGFILLVFVTALFFLSDHFNGGSTSKA